MPRAESIEPTGRHEVPVPHDEAYPAYPERPISDATKEEPAK